MNKAWKRLLMLGMLIGCMATAAWAGNVEADVEDNSDYYLESVAPDYYQTGMKQYVTGTADPTETETIQSYFDANGYVTWESIQASYGTTTARCDYDADGNLTKVVSKYVDQSGYIVLDTTTYTYDQQGRLTQRRITPGEEEEEGYNSVSYYEYGDRKITVKVYGVTEDGTEELRTTTVYTLDQNGVVTERTMSDEAETLSTSRYTYDAKGNLVSIVTTGEEAGTVTFTYNDQDLCVKSVAESDDPDAYIQKLATTYEYDAQGNLVKMVMGDDVTIVYTYDKIPASGSVSAFSDVKPSDYYNAPVIWAGENGITQGVSATQFCPGNPCTRAQLVTFLWRAAGSPEPENSTNPFTDVNPKAYYAKAVLWAVENGITNGTSKTEFSPDAKCTRAQIVTFIYRAAGESEVESAGNTFTDVNPKAYYAKAVLWAVENGITNGYANGEFRPDNTCTRGQGVTFLYRGFGLY